MLNQGSALHFHPTLSHRPLLVAVTILQKVWKEEVRENLACHSLTRFIELSKTRVMSVIAVESQVSIFLRKYTPAIEAQLREARTRLRAMFPRGFELVYDNYNALVFGISPTERTSDAFISIAGYPRWVTLFFLHGADLRDAHGLLEGQGKQVRSVRLTEPKDINKPEIEALIAQAVLPYESAFLAAPSLSTIVKSVSAKQRPRRPRK